jgi:hypothetical protein
MIRPTDKYGNVLLYKDYWTVEGGKVYETDAYGNAQQQKFEIKDEQRPSE